MKAFAALYAELDASRSVTRKVDAMVAYLREAPAADAAWAVFFLAGGKARQVVPSRRLRQLAGEAAGIPDWLVEASYAAVGDLAETLAHLVPDGPFAGSAGSAGLASWMTERLLPLRTAEPEVQAIRLRQWWSDLDRDGRFLLNKLITAGLRVGVSKGLVIRALARVAGVDEPLMAQRMIGYTARGEVPDIARYRALVAPAGAADEDPTRRGHPYPFFLAHALGGDAEPPGVPTDWLIEWKWDGIRAQVVLRQGQCWIWSRGEELVTERFPEIESAARQWADATAPGRALVLDGELLAWDAVADRPLPFAALQRRLNRQAVSKVLLREAPVLFLAYDLLEWEGEDWRSRPQDERRDQLERLLGPLDTRVDAMAATPHDRAMQAEAVAPGASRRETEPTRLRLSPRVQGDDWQAVAALRAQSRVRGVEGLMLKRLASPYGVGRTRAEGADWLKWKIEPFTIDAVLVYAQPGHGRRASLFTDYTFALWEAAPGPDAAPALLPIAKAYSGLTDDEIRQVDAIIRKTSQESFGPVRRVTPTLVFELAFEGISRSPRHKSGVAVRFPRILRWRQDKSPDQADTIDALRALLS